MTKTRHGWRILLADTAIFGSLFGLTNVVSYLFMVVAGRTLSPMDFGVFNALLGLLGLAGIFATSLQVAIAQAVAGHASRFTLTRLVKRTTWIALPAVAALALATAPFAPTIGAKPDHVVVWALAVFTVFLATAAMGFLVGFGRVRAQAGVNLLGSLARLGVAWPLMALGFGISGALFGYAVNYLLVFVLSYAICWRLSDDHSTGLANAAPSLKFDISSIATFLLVFAPFSLDQFMVQSWNPALGGDYAATATIGKLVYFATSPIAAVAYPYMLRQSDKRARLQVLAVAGAVVFGAAFSLAWVLGNFSSELVGLFFGTQFPGAVSHVGVLAFGAACFSLAALIAHALIAFGERIGFLPSLVALAVAVPLLAYRHDSMTVVVENQLWVYELQLILMLALLALTILRSLRRHTPAATEGKVIL